MVWRVVKLAVVGAVVGAHFTALSAAWLSLAPDASLPTTLWTLATSLLHPAKAALLTLAQPMISLWNTVRFTVGVATRPLLTMLGLQHLVLWEVIKLLVLLTGTAARELLLGYALLVICLFYVAEHVGAAVRCVQWASRERIAIEARLCRATEVNHVSTSAVSLPGRIRLRLSRSAIRIHSTALLILTRVGEISPGLLPLCNLFAAGLGALFIVMFRVVVLPLFVLDLARRVVSASRAQKKRSS